MYPTAFQEDEFLDDPTMFWRGPKAMMVLDVGLG